MKHNEYESKQTLIVFKTLGFEDIGVETPEITYLYHRDIPDEIIVDNTLKISYKVISKQLQNIGINDWIFDSLYKNL